MSNQKKNTKQNDKHKVASPLSSIQAVQKSTMKKHMTETETETETENDNKSGIDEAQKLAIQKSLGGTADEHEAKQRFRSFKTRAVTSLMMIMGFFFIITLGHLYCSILVLQLTSSMYKEIISLKRKKEKDEKIIFSWLDWYYFIVFSFFIIPKLFLRRILVEDFIEPGTLVYYILYDYHNIISFNLFVLGILFFVWSLEKGSYRYQFSRFAWSILALILVFCMPSFISYNLYKGFFWFVLPCSCVISNDIFAYLFGFFLGKTPLIKLSPKKTWEGFIGGLVGTYLFAFLATDFLCTQSFFICPQTHLTISIFENLQCDPQYVFIKKFYDLPFNFMGYTQFYTSPAHIHSFFIATFASLIAPFGGFFASGVKRAFRIKDFGDTIPGHGGITDRFDCQGLMAIFIYCYLTQVVFRSADSMEKVLDYVHQMSLNDKIVLLDMLKKQLFENATAAAIINSTLGGIGNI